MWSYVMAASRGDSRRHRSPESVFTVQPAVYGPQPGPLCRDVLRYCGNSGSLNSNSKEQIQHPFLSRRKDEIPSRNASADTLAEVTVQNSIRHPFSESTESQNDLNRNISDITSHGSAQQLRSACEFISNVTGTRYATPYNFGLLQ
ncbi:hypothetical protein WA026_016947 [Henosepilachna vigintioctopunctata]|uniref:Uncharacterized protein n=1 Tax=Henosepilachna vigintioctopunctata TaxID=420089 RepID=A0AAW1UD66_9CUCU